MRILITDVADGVEQGLRSIRDPIAMAATDAIRQAGDQAKVEGRNAIGSAGFGAKWKNAWRVSYFPKKGTSIDAAAWLFHKIPYSLIFEEGGTIVGRRGLLWIPLPTVPKIGQRKATPRRLAQSGVKLFSFKSRKGRPLLGASARVPRTSNKLSLSLSKLRSGSKGSRGIVRAIPLFIGVPSVTIRARFNLAAVVNAARGAVPGFYVASVKDV